MNSAVAETATRQRSATSESNSSLEEQMPSSAMEHLDENPAESKAQSLGIRGNKCTQNEEYDEAVSVFTEAIQLNPQDHRFFGNRSYCYLMLKDYENSLRDAIHAVKIAPHLPKGHYRKGCALAALRKYKRAEMAFEEVVRLDPACYDAQQELTSARVCQLRELGYTKYHAEQAILKFKTVQRALEVGYNPDEENITSDDVYWSDDESETDSNPQSPGNQDEMLHISSSLWVGNVQQTVDDKKLRALFSKCGKVNSVKILAEKFCGFVNYKTTESAVLAMEKLSGYILDEKALVLKYSRNNNPSDVNAPHRVMKSTGVECYYWRQGYCKNGKNCHFAHADPKNLGANKKQI